MSEFPFEFVGFRQATQSYYRLCLAPVMQEYALTQMELDILLFLANNPQYDSFSALVSVRGLTKSHVSTSVERLVQHGYLRRLSDSKNARLQHLLLTPEVEPVLQAGRARQAFFFQTLFDGISKEDKSVFIQVSNQIQLNIKSALKGSEDEA